MPGRPAKKPMRVQLPRERLPMYSTGWAGGSGSGRSAPVRVTVPDVGTPKYFPSSGSTRAAGSREPTPTIRMSREELEGVYNRAAAELQERIAEEKLNGSSATTTGRFIRPPEAVFEGQQGTREPWYIPAQGTVTRRMPRPLQEVEEPASAAPASAAPASAAPASAAKKLNMVQAFWMKNQSLKSAQTRLEKLDKTIKGLTADRDAKVKVLKDNGFTDSEGGVLTPPKVFKDAGSPEATDARKNELLTMFIDVHDLNAKLKGHATEREKLSGSIDSMKKSLEVYGASLPRTKEQKKLEKSARNSLRDELETARVAQEEATGAHIPRGIWSDKIAPLVWGSPTRKFLTTSAGIITLASAGYSWYSDKREKQQLEAEQAAIRNRDLRTRTVEQTFTLAEDQLVRKLGETGIDTSVVGHISHVSQHYSAKLHSQAVNMIPRGPQGEVVYGDPTSDEALFRAMSGVSELYRNVSKEAYSKVDGFHGTEAMTRIVSRSLDDMAFDLEQRGESSNRNTNRVSASKSLGDNEMSIAIKGHFLPSEETVFRSIGIPEPVIFNYMNRRR